MGALTPMSDEVFNLVLQMILNHHGRRRMNLPQEFFRTDICLQFINMEDGVDVVWCSSDLGVARSELDLLYSVMGCI